MMKMMEPKMAAEPEHAYPSRDEVLSLCDGRHGDPFAILGPHQAELSNGLGSVRVVRFLAHFAEACELVLEDGTRVPMQRLYDDALFEGLLPDSAQRYQVAVGWPGGFEQIVEDPYRFGPVLDDFELHLLAEGRHRELTSALGANVTRMDGVKGVSFAVWAPNARRVSVVGDFNGWDGRRTPMRLRHYAGTWEIFVPGLDVGARYKYELVAADGSIGAQKADPVARATEPPPATASVVAGAPEYPFTDQAWIQKRADTNYQRAPFTAYEMHVGSWLRSVNDPVNGWDILGDKLIPYVKGMGFTHIELMPITEHPFGGSWGYQPISMFAPSARYGTPEGFARFIDRCHGADIGVILDWVPAHFPTDAHGLAHFDGTSLYEYADPREGFHRDWDTYIFNFGRNEVRGFLVSSAMFWLNKFHIDGLRVDAVASMLYRDYSRKPGEWIPNIYGGRENLEAIAFIKDLNLTVSERAPGAVMIAEESTSFPRVSAPVDEGGLGFHFKWDMGWMHDTLNYFELPPIHRSYHNNLMTFGMMYAYAEHFVLPLSHDEVVYGKGSLYSKMPGDWWQKFANLRAYLGFMWTRPGKKLIFMGGELAAPLEWNHDAELDWDLLGDPSHLGVQRWLSDLNHTLRDEPALYQDDERGEGFRWVVVDDPANSVFAYLRFAHNAAPILVVCNLTPVIRHDYKLGVTVPGLWKELLNSDASRYAGSNQGNGGGREAYPEPSHGLEFSLTLTLPPLATLILKPA
jgi:1,4-alpha-glucan branching enzyme